MKKIYLKVLVTLVIGAILSFGTINLLQYNCYITEMCDITSIVFGILGILSICFAKLAKDITREDVKIKVKNVDGKAKKKLETEKIIFSIINLILYSFILGILILIENNVDSIRGNGYYNSLLRYEFEEFYSIIQLIITMALSTMEICSIFKYNEKECKFISIIGKIFSRILIAFSIIASLYVSLPINEFKYAYIIDNGEIGIVATGMGHSIYQDIRTSDNMNDDDVFIPSKLWGKDVKYCEGIYTANPNINIYLPATIDYEYIKFFYISYDGEKIDGNVFLVGNNDEYYIKNNAIYSKDGKEITIIEGTKFKGELLDESN